MESILTNSLLSDKLNKILAFALSKEKSFACWSKPDDEHLQVIVSDEIKKLNKNFQIEKLDSGFLFAPFDQDNQVIYLSASSSWTFPNEDSEIPEIPSEGKELHPGKARFHNTPNEHYTDIVEKSIQQISKGDVEKIVPARIKSIPLNENFDAIAFFLNLIKQYPDAFVSFVSIPKIGTWIGASPETLIRVNNNTFNTVALAGTQPYEPSIPVRETSWTQKEIEEQALVSRYIINCFKKIRLREFDEFGPKTVRAGNLLHLKTEFQVDMKATNFPDLGSIMLQLLHPTSAVSGMPADKAKAFIKEHEDFDREFYAGYLGPVNFDNSTDIFVNLRCLQLINDFAIIYAGAGVTLDSEPVKELNETEIKMHTLIRMLK